MLDEDAPGSNSNNNNNILYTQSQQQQLKKKRRSQERKKKRVPPFIRAQRSQAHHYGDYNFQNTGPFGPGFYLKKVKKIEGNNIPAGRPIPNIRAFDRNLTINQIRESYDAPNRYNIISSGRPLPNFHAFENLPSNTSNNVANKTKNNVVNLVDDNGDNGNPNSNNNDWIPPLVNLTDDDAVDNYSNFDVLQRAINNTAQNDISQILSIFPNVKVTWVRKKLQEYRQVDTLISFMAENDFPKEKESKNESASHKEDYKVVDKKRITSPSYRKDARLSLAMKFKRVTYATIDLYFKVHCYQYVPTIEAMLADQDEATGKIKNAELLKNTRVDQSYLLNLRMDSQLRREIKWLENENMRKLSEIDIILQNSKVSQKPNTECGCCFGDFIEEATIQCSEGHKFCGTCLNRYVQEEVFGKQSAKIKCMDMSGKCKGEYNNATLKRALPPIVLEKYEFAIAQHALKAAKIDDLVNCPFCDAIAILPVGNNIFSCPRPSCKIESCRKCRKKSHIPFKCDEVDGKSAEEIRRKIEEKMTEAKVRSCPKCSTRFFKEVRFLLLVTAIHIHHYHILTLLIYQIIIF